jgi:hypothetical protein
MKLLTLPVLMGKSPFAHLLIPIDLISRYLARVCVCVCTVVYCVAVEWENTLLVLFVSVQLRITQSLRVFRLNESICICIFLLL